MAAVLVGANHSRSLPAFLEQAFSVPIQQIASPGFAFRNGRGVSLAGSLVGLARGLPAYHNALATLSETIQAIQPNLIVNFLDPLMGLCNLLRPHAVPVLVVGHQFMLEHPGFVKVKKFPLQQFAMRRFLRLTGARSARLALSFYPAPGLPQRGLFVCPPILRRQLFELQPDASGGYLLVYLLNHGYAGQIIRWHREHPDIPVHCYYDKPGAPLEDNYDGGLVFHRLDGEKFLRMMARCRGVACTAGFESVSEAAYLGKPLLLVPVENHVEQYLNASDAEQAGIGIRDTAFRLSRLLGLPVGQAQSGFQQWVNQAEAIVMEAVELTAARKRKRNSKLQAPSFRED